MNDHSEKEKPALSPSIQQWIAEEAIRREDEWTCKTSMSVRSAFEQFALAVAARVQPQWQPIETAPKDGTEVLLTDGRYKRTAYWAKRIERWSVDAVVSLPDPRHWMPLPLPPDPEAR